MFNFNNIFRIAAAATASAALLVSCVGLEQDQNDAVGYLAAPSLDVDLTVDDLLLTKALDFEVEEPSLVAVHFIVKDKDGTARYDADGLWDEPIVLPVGAYTVEAYYGSNGFGAPYFTGTASGSVAQLAEERPELTLSLSNSLVRVTVDSSLEGHFIPGSEVSFNDGAHVAGYGEWTYVPSGAVLTLTLSGTSSTGSAATFTHKLTSPSAKVAYDVVCGKSETNWPSITMSEISADDVWASRINITTPASFTGSISDANKAKVVYEAIPATSSDWESAISSIPGDPVIKGLTPGVEYQVRAKAGALVSSNVAKVTPYIDGLSVSADHTYDSGVLDGTDVTSTFSKSEAVKSAISSWTISLCKADGTVLRSHLSLGTSDGSAITVTNGWPYLPTGNGEAYVLKASAVMDGQTYTFEDMAVTGLSTPDFTLSMSSYTSYDKYAATNNIASNVNDANACDPGTLYNAGGKWGISTNLMKNTNYTKTLVIDIDGNTDRTYTVSGYDYNELYEDITGLGWSSHTLKVSMTFDNKTVSRTQTHHITGLPHKIEQMGKSRDYGWTWGNTSFTQNDRASMTYNDSWGLSPKFYIPEDKTATVSVNAYAIAYKLTLNYKPSLYVTASSTAEKSGTSKEIATQSSNPGAGLSACKLYQYYDIVFTSSVSNLSVYAYSAKGSGACAVFFAKCEILYQ